MLYRKIAKEILAMKHVDQELRARNIRDPEYWDDEIDPRHTARMKEIIIKIGWPTISKVGPEGTHAAWLLVQHADHDVDFQKECLALMKSASELEVYKADIAYLEDRVRVSTGQPQLYGTQFTEVEGKFIPRPIEDPERVDERRRQVGLGTLREAVQYMYEKYHWQW